MKHGYGFYWFPGLGHIYVRPDGKVLLHYLDDMIPYLVEPQGSSFQDFGQFRIDSMWIPDCALPAVNLALPGVVAGSGQGSEGEVHPLESVDDSDDEGFSWAKSSAVPVETQAAPIKRKYALPFPRLRAKGSRSRMNAWK